MMVVVVVMVLLWRCNGVFYSNILSKVIEKMKKNNTIQIVGGAMVMLSAMWVIDSFVNSSS